MVYRYMLDDKTTEEKEEILREEFSNIDKKDSIRGILVNYLEANGVVKINGIETTYIVERVYIGFPYEIAHEIIIPSNYDEGTGLVGNTKRRVLVVGGYQKLSLTNMPKDFESRKKRIPLESIVSFVKV